MKYLPLYFEWMEKGKMPEHGLCYSLPCYADLLKLFTPSEGDADEGNYWGYDGAPRNMFNDYLNIDAYQVYEEFTPLRQNIILLMAAMNGELTTKNLKQYNQR